MGETKTERASCNTLVLDTHQLLGCPSCSRMPEVILLRFYLATLPQRSELPVIIARVPVKGLEAKEPGRVKLCSAMQAHKKQNRRQYLVGSVGSYMP